MASTASDKLKLELQADGENDQTWGAKINVALERLEQATAGETTVSLQALGGANYTLDDTQYVKGSGTTAEAHRMVLNLTGTMDANENVIVPARTKLYVVRNNTSGSFTATVKTSAGTGIAVTQGTSALLYCDGTNVVDMLAAYDLSGDFALPGDITPSQITANTNDYAPTGLSTATVLRLDTDASRNLTGLTGGADGRIIIIDNIGSFDLVLTDEDAASTAANRFALAGNATVPAGGTIALKYDSTASRWRAFGGLSQGDIGVTLQGYDAGISTTPLIQGTHALNLPARAWKEQETSGCASLSSEESSTNKLVTEFLAFDKDAIEYAQVSFRLPKGANHSATLTGEIEWKEASGATAHVCVWQVEMQMQGDGDTIDSSWGTAVTATDTGSSGTRRFIAFTAVTPAGTPAQRDKLVIRLSRKATDGSDTLDVDAHFIEMQGELTINSGDDS